VRRRLLVVLGGAVLLLQASCGPDSETSQLIKRLHSGSTSARLKAISEAETQPANACLRAELLLMVENSREEPLVRGGAALALGRLHDDRLPGRVVKRLPEAILAPAKAGQLQTEAFILAKALTAYGPDSLPTVAALLEHPRKEVVAWTIAHHGLYRRNDRALGVLAEYLKSPEPVYRRSAAYGLAQSFHRAGELLVLKHLGDPDAEVRYHLAWALANFGSGKALGAAQAQLSHEKEAHVKSELARALAEIRARQGG
jgi:HEAT repeat protein